jgi:hypothetical protein
MFIYKYEFPNGKIYIGKSHLGAKRFGNTSSYARCPYVRAEMLAHPEFKKSIIMRCRKEDVDYWESYWIKYFDSYFYDNKQIGLNLTPGGDGHRYGCSVSEETRKKISETELSKHRHLSLKHRNALMKANLGSHKSEETKKKLSESHMGIKQSPEEIAKRVEKLKGHKCPESLKKKLHDERKGIPPAECVLEAARKMIRCIETGIVYKSIREAGNSVGCSSYSHICRAAKTGIKAGGYHWEYAMIFYKRALE